MNTYIIYDEINFGYWDRTTNEFRGINYATKYEGNSIDEIEIVIKNNPDIPEGFYSVKRIIEKK